MMNQNLKEKLKGYAKIAHEQFDNAFTEIVNRTQAIASVDNGKIFFRGEVYAL